MDTEQPKPHSFRREQLALVLCFVLSRAAFYVAGVQFDLRPLDTSWQILDPVLLREDLLRSVFYMSGQPPLYNLMLGAVLKLSHDPQLTALLLRGLYAGLSLGCVLLLHALLGRLQVGRSLRLPVGGLFMISPALILYENIPYYTLHVVTLLTLSCLLLHRLIERCTFGRALALFATMATLIYVRSMFQLYWFVVLLGYCLLVLPGHRKQLLRAAALPLLLIVALYGKNLLVTGHFGSSHWLGMSATKLSALRLPEPLREQLVSQGKLSPLALQPAYETPERLPQYFASTPKTGIPVLDQGRKSTEHVNYNALPYVAVSRDSLHDALYAMKHYPGVYLEAVATSFVMFMRPASDYPFLKDNRDAIDGYARLYAKLVAGQPVYPPDPWFDYEPGTAGYLLAASYLLSVAYGLYLLVACARRRKASAEEATLLFMWLTIMYVSVIGNAFEIGENQRFRFSINPLMLSAVCVLATRGWRAYQRRSTRLARSATEAGSSPARHA